MTDTTEPHDEVPLGRWRKPPARHRAQRPGGSRRLVLGGLVAAAVGGGSLGTAALVGEGGDTEQDSLAARIDVHHHAMPPEIRRWMVDHWLLPPVGGPPFSIWDAGQALATLDEHAIDLAVLSAAIPAVSVPDRAQAQELSRLANEALAEVVKDRPTRYGLFAHLPLGNVEDALVELAYAYDDLHADGVILMAHTGETYLGDPTLDPVVAELDSRSAVVLVHPFNLPGAAPAGSPVGMPPYLADFYLDTTRAALQIVKNAVLNRFPRVRWILAHGGGFLPYLGTRATHLGTALGYGVADDTLRDALRRFYYDTAGPMSPYATPSLLAAAGADRILYGSDYNAVPATVVGANRRAFANDTALDQPARRLIGRDNALALLPAVASKLGVRP